MARPFRPIAAAVGATKKLWRVPGAEHYDWMDRVDANWWRALVDYLLADKAHNT